MHGLPQKTPRREPESVTPKDIDVQHRRGLARLQTISSSRSDSRSVRRKRTIHAVIGHLGEPVGPPHVAGEHCCALYPAHVIYTQWRSCKWMLPAPGTTGMVTNLRSIAAEWHRTPPCIWFAVERVSANCR